MKIVFSPLYSGSCYINLQKRRDSLLGLKVCGSIEFLSELELRAGIVSQEISEPERLIAFHKALSKNVHGTIFEPSFNTDEVGVARQLMLWCDNLMMEGWTPNTNVGTVKLKALAKIANGVNDKHVAQRWKELTAFLKNHTIFQKDDVIEVHTQDIIPAVIKATLDELSKQANVKYVGFEGDMPDVFHVYQFRTRIDAYRWYLSQPEVLNDLDITISSDNCILNDMAMAMGRPVVNSKSQNSNPQLLQLFKLGMSLFARPLNVYNLLSYLQVSGNPLGGVSYKLARVLADEGGINDAWNKVIKEYDFTDDEGKDKRADKLAFIEMLNKDYEADKILVDDVKSYAGKLAHWCDQSLRSDSIDEERKEQLVVLASFCRSLHQILPADGYISSETLKAHVDGIYRPQSFTHVKARKNAPDTIASVTQLADNANKVCWLGCVGGALPSYPFDFLNTSELSMLQENGIFIPSRSVFYTQQHNQEMDALKHVKQLILVTWEFDGNVRQEEHPLVTELKHRYKDSWDSHVSTNAVPNLTEKKDAITTLEPRASYQLSDKLKDIKREKESYSSVSTLIQHPFDYTMAHLLRLNEPQIGQLPDLDITKGLVAHRFVEMLVKQFGEQMPMEFNKMDQDTMDQQIDEAIQQKGAILFLPEYKIDCQQFKDILKDSVTVLVNIIQNLHLKPVDSEVEFNVNLKKIEAFSGSIDLVLKNANEQLVIFDFKWSEGKTYEAMLKENKSVQLELYKQAAQLHFGNKVAGVAYYLFPKKTLYTTDFSNSENIREVKINTADEKRKLYKEVQNSYEYRRKELDHGRIEESELTKLETIPYYEDNNTDTPLYCLEPDYNNKELKGCPYVKVGKPPFVKKKGSWNKPQNPKEIKTTHPILKGRLA